MAQFTIEDLDPALLEKLEKLAKEHGRSVEAELKHILEKATQSQSNNLADDWKEIRKKADLMRQQIINHAASKGIEIKPPEKKSDPTKVIQEFRLLRQTISVGDMSIREMREEGRRF